jgi:hypothetical protein
VRIQFRQGIVSHQASGFLNFNGLGNVSIVATTRPVTLAVADKSSNYLFTEDLNVANAWIGPFASGVSYWLYWNFDTTNFTRSFGYTDLEPIVQPTEPNAILLRTSQTQNDYNGSGNNGTFTGGDGVGPNFYAAGDTITLSNNAQIVVTAVDSSGDVTDFEVLERGSTVVTTGQLLSQTSTTGNGSAFSITVGAANKSSGLRVGQVWFDTTRNEMFEYVGAAWKKVYYVFAARLNNGLLSSVSASAPAYTGTQIGNTSSVLAGRVVYLTSGKVVRKDDNTCFTTEDQFFIDAGTSSAIRLEANVIRAKSTEVAMAAHTIVAFSGEGEIRTAQYNDAQSTICAVLTESLVLNAVGTVVPQGVVYNDDWDFSALPVGTAMWVDNGTLTSVDPHVTNTVLYPTSKPPVARVLSRTGILFEQGLGGVGPKGPTGSITNLPAATPSALGAVVLSTPALNSAIPIVVGDNDPRLVGGPYASAFHTHAAGEVLFVPTGALTATNVQTAIGQIEQTSVSTTGATFTGPLVLSGAPSAPLEAATKQYVDTYSVSKAGGTFTGPVLMSADPTDLLGIATKQYVDNNSASGSFVDLTTDQEIAGNKTFTEVVDIFRAGNTGAPKLTFSEYNSTIGFDMYMESGTLIIKHNGGFHTNLELSDAFAELTTGTDMNRVGLYVQNTGVRKWSLNDQDGSGGFTPVLEWQVGAGIVGEEDVIMARKKIKMPLTVSGDDPDVLTTKSYVDAASGVSVLNDLTDVDTSTILPSDGDMLTFDSTNGWQPTTKYREIPVSFTGVLPDATTITNVMLTSAYSVATESTTGTGSHRGRSQIAPSGGDATLILKKNGLTTFCTITVVDGTNVCLFDTTSETFTAGDYIEVTTVGMNSSSDLFFSLKLKDEVSV